MIAHRVGRSSSDRHALVIAPGRSRRSLSQKSRRATPQSRRAPAERTRVDSEGRRIGIVEDVLYGAEYDRPSAFLVRTGIFKRRLEAISLEDVEAIYPRAQRLSVRAFIPK